MRKPINLTKDRVFQYFFTHYKDSLKSLLKAFLPLPEGHKIQEVHILDPRSISGNPRDKRCIFDLRLKLNTGEWVNVEMQNFHQADFKKRVLFYLSKMYIFDLKQGKPYKDLCPAYSLVFASFKVFPKVRDFYSSFSMRSDQDPHFLFSPKEGLRIVIVDLSQFKKERVSELVDLREDWCYALKNSKKMDEKEMKELAKRGGDMKTAVEQIFGMSEEQIQKEMREQNERDHLMIQDTIAFEKKKSRKAGLAEGEAKGKALGIQEGEAKGRTEGKALGIQEGEAKGKALGIQEGEAKGQAIVAVKMLQKGFSVEDVQELTGLSKTQLLQLKKQ